MGVTTLSAQHHVELWVLSEILQILRVFRWHSCKMSNFPLISAVSQNYVLFPIRNRESSQFSWFLPKQALLEFSPPIVTCFLIHQFVKFCWNDRLTPHSIEIPRLCTVIAIATCRIYFFNQALTFFVLLSLTISLSSLFKVRHPCTH